MITYRREIFELATHFNQFAISIIYQDRKRIFSAAMVLGGRPIIVPNTLRKTDEILPRNVLGALIDFSFTPNMSSIVSIVHPPKLKFAKSHEP